MGLHGWCLHCLDDPTVWYEQKVTGLEEEDLSIHLPTVDPKPFFGSLSESRCHAVVYTSSSM